MDNNMDTEKRMNVWLWDNWMIIQLEKYDYEFLQFNGRRWVHFTFIYAGHELIEKIKKLITKITAYLS